MVSSNTLSNGNGFEAAAKFLGCICNLISSAECFLLFFPIYFIHIHVRERRYSQSGTLFSTDAANDGDTKAAQTCFRCITTLHNVSQIILM